MNFLKQSFYSNIVILCGIAFGSVCLTGCDTGSGVDYSSLGLVPVSGEVTLDGEPLGGAVVFFEAPDLTQAYAKTDDQGKYTIKFNSEIEGVQPGSKIVRISTTASTGEEGIEEDELEGDDDGSTGRSRSSKKKSAKPGELVPPQYNSKSTLTVEITSGNSVVDFHLKSDGSNVTPMKS
ncbi:hypothetical protein [Rhodopirellula sallentina]|nr:hypothetical protein [Rhodopirellula sallentina]